MRLELHAPFVEGLIRTTEDPGDRFRLAGAARFESSSHRPPEGGFVVHLGDPERTSFALHLPLEKAVFEVWRCRAGGFDRVLQHPTEPPVVGRITRFLLRKDGRRLWFAWDGVERIGGVAFEGLDGPLGLSAKYCEVSVWSFSLGGT